MSRSNNKAPAVEDVLQELKLQVIGVPYRFRMMDDVNKILVPLWGMTEAKLRVVRLRAVLKAMDQILELIDDKDLHGDNLNHAWELYDVLEDAAIKLNPRTKKNEDGAEKKNDDAPASKDGEEKRNDDAPASKKMRFA